MVDEVVVVAKRDKGWLRACVEHEEREERGKGPSLEQQDQQQANQDRKNEQEKKDQEKKDQQQAQSSGDQKDKEDQKGEPAQPMQAHAMTPQEAQQLLDAQKGEEQFLQLRPAEKQARRQPLLKDW